MSTFFEKLGQIFYITREAFWEWIDKLNGLLNAPAIPSSPGATSDIAVLQAEAIKVANTPRPIARSTRSILNCAPKFRLNGVEEATYGNPLPLLHRIDTLEREKDAVYKERNWLVAALSRTYPSGRRKTVIQGWDPEWHNCVYLDLPTGQVSWHYHDSEAAMFEGLPLYTRAFDGHDKETVKHRLLSLRQPIPRTGEIAWLMEESDRSSSELAWVVVALSRAYPSGRRKTPVEGLDPVAWPNTVFIDLPTGQVAWHYPESFAGPFEDLPPYIRPYDGHERVHVKYRLLSLVRMVNRQYLQDFIDIHRNAAMTCDELHGPEIANIAMWCDKLENFIKAVERGHLEGCHPRVYWN